MTSITPFLWFDNRAGEALDFYSTVFEHSTIIDVNRVGDPSSPDGGFMMGTIELENTKLILFNGGPFHAFNEAISLFVSCESQAEVDRLWGELCDGGEPGRCGWLKDRFGVSWQIVPTLLGELMGDPDPAKSKRVFEAMMKMDKLESSVLQTAYDGE